MKNIVQTITAVLFLVFIFGMGGFYIAKNCGIIGNTMIDRQSSAEQKIRSLENIYTSEVPGKEHFIDLYGAVQRGLGKKEIENFTYVKTNYGKIEQLWEEKSEEELEQFADNIKAVDSYAKQKEIPVFYLTSILPVVEKTDLPYGVTEYSHENAEHLMSALEERSIDMIDLRELNEVLEIGKEELFYRTDHHWSIETCFAAFRGVIREINARLGWELDPQGMFTDLESYEKYVLAHGFLGSYGIKVGKYYAGKDDFSVYLPKFHTDMTFQSYMNHE